MPTLNEIDIQRLQALYKSAEGDSSDQDSSNDDDTSDPKNVSKIIFKLSFVTLLGPLNY